MRRAALLLAALLASASPAAAQEKPLTSAEIVKAAGPADWRTPDPENTLYMELEGGRVVIELAARLVPNHAANIRTLVREGWFDGLAIVRVQENYVTQWGDPTEKKPVRNGKKQLPAEFLAPNGAALPFAKLPDGDVYAPEVGFVDGFPVGRDPATGAVWPLHCYGMVGAGRDMTADSGSGAELYAVIGQAPRHLDRNMTVVGRVLKGMELLTALPRGTGPLGFYETPEQRRPITAVRLAADVPEAERTKLEVLRTDTATFAAYIESRRNRREPFFLVPLGKVDVCNVPLVTRDKP
ncbi:MAG TPA: peptidylprolyl isomerase [Azospirillaceae bacterium]|nr:peptidylprolyl isomerase [Azospirillaceae bacterium]